jgi:hypothetical protein
MSFGMKGNLVSAACVLMAVVGIRAANGATYIVDQSHPRAADTNPGTPEAPWKTIGEAAATAKAGDTVCVMEGKYAERVTLKNSGREGQMITFRAVPRQSVETEGFTTGSAAYVRIEGFTIHPPLGRTAGVEISSDHVEVVDNFFYDSALAIAPQSSGDSPANVRLAYNKVYQAQEGIWVGGSKWIVECNEVCRAKWLGVWGDADYMRPFGTDHVLRYNFLHGSKPEEIGPAHLDSFQFFDSNGEIGKRIEVCYNVLYDFHQSFMGESATPDHAGDWTFHHNIASSKMGAWGICNVGIPGLKAINNTYYGIKWYGVGIHGKQAEGGLIRNNIFQKISQAISVKDALPTRDHNIIFDCDKKDAGDKDLVGMDPKMVDPERLDFRLQRGSVAIGAGDGGATIGALEYPNVYYVDPRHPGATDEAFGYAGQPYKTLAKALETAQAGETVILRGGVYRETLTAGSDGVTVRAMEGEKATISGADVVEGWKRDGQVWAAALAAEPKKLLRDGQPWTDFSYDKEGKRIVLKSGDDPRLRLFETVVRERGIDLGAKKGVKIEGIDVENTLGMGK